MHTHTYTHNAYTLTHTHTMHTHLLLFARNMQISFLLKFFVALASTKTKLWTMCKRKYSNGRISWGKEEAQICCYFLHTHTHTHTHTHSHTFSLLRSSALLSAVNFGNPEVTNAARALFLAWRANGTRHVVLSLDTSHPLEHTHTHTHTHTTHTYTTHTRSLDPNIKAAVYSAGIALGTEEDWNFMWQYYTNITEPYEMKLVRLALSYSPSTSTLSRYGD